MEQTQIQPHQRRIPNPIRTIIGNNFKRQLSYYQSPQQEEPSER